MYSLKYFTPSYVTQFDGKPATKDHAIHELISTSDPNKFVTPQLTLRERVVLLLSGRLQMARGRERRACIQQYNTSLTHHVTIVMSCRRHYTLMSRIFTILQIFIYPRFIVLLSELYCTVPNVVFFFKERIKSFVIKLSIF